MQNYIVITLDADEVKYLARLTEADHRAQVRKAMKPGKQDANRRRLAEVLSFRLAAEAEFMAQGDQTR
jgi:hypothetical protein